MSSYGKTTHSTEETVEHTVDCDESTKSECSTQSSAWGAGCADMGLWVAVIVLIIIWTLAVWAGWSWFSSGNNKGGKGGKNCDNQDGYGGGCAGAGLLWLIILILFVAAAWRCGWGAVVGFLVFFLIILLIGWWCWSSC